MFYVFWTAVPPYSQKVFKQQARRPQKMINNNPYSIPERPLYKHNRIYTETTSHSFRNDSVQNTPSYLNPNPPPGTLQLMRRSTMAKEDIPAGFRPPHYPYPRPEAKNYIGSPKGIPQSTNGSYSQLSSSGSYQNIPVQNNTQGGGSNHNIGQGGSNSVGMQQKGETSRAVTSVRELLSTAVDQKDIADRVDGLASTVKSHEKKLAEIEQILNSNIRSRKMFRNEWEILEKLEDRKQEEVSRLEDQDEKQRRKLHEQITRVRQQIKVCLKSNDIDRFLNERVKQLMVMNKTSDNLCDSKDPPRTNDTSTDDGDDVAALRKQIEKLNAGLEEKIGRVSTLVAESLGSLQKQVTGLLENPPALRLPEYKSSGVRCTSKVISVHLLQTMRLNPSLPQGPAQQAQSQAQKLEVTLSQILYYLDPEGYLLDGNQCYILDESGMQVRLEEKHRELLYQHNAIA